MKLHIEPESKRERFIYRMLIVWAIFGIVGIIAKVDLIALAGYFGAFGIYGAAYLAAESYRKSDKPN